MVLLSASLVLRHRRSSCFQMYFPAAPLSGLLLSLSPFAAALNAPWSCILCVSILTPPPFHWVPRVPYPTLGILHCSALGAFYWAPYTGCPTSWSPTSGIKPIAGRPWHKAQLSHCCHCSAASFNSILSQHFFFPFQSQKKALST